MTNTPSLFPPLNFQEQNILVDLQHIQEELTLLKQDRSKYIKLLDVQLLYDKTIQQVQLLNNVRAMSSKEHDKVL